MVITLEFKDTGVFLSTYLSANHSNYCEAADQADARSTSAVFDSIGGKFY